MQTNNTHTTLAELLVALTAVLDTMHEMIEKTLSDSAPAQPVALQPAGDRDAAAE